tara:strand:- start:1268 stop:1615 length:348 start_codon:yes stop_codon:yes gene_type:complete
MNIISSSLGVTPRGFSNFTWTSEAIDSWERVWGALWKIGIKWEWQNRDPYARRRGEIFNIFAVHDDAIRLDMALPLPGREIILEIHEYLLDLPTDDFYVDQATNLIRKWIKEYVE